MKRLAVDAVLVLAGVALGLVIAPDADARDAGVLGNPVPSAGTVNHVRSTSEPVPTSTTSTTSVPQRTAPTPPASVAPGRDNPDRAGADVVVLRSTSYCLTGNMASGRPTYVGAVASNRFALGTRVTAWPNPWGDPGMVFTVEDRHARSDANGFPTELDFAMPGECDRALAWGNRQHVRVQVVG